MYCLVLFGYFMRRKTCLERLCGLKNSAKGGEFVYIKAKIEYNLKEYRNAPNEAGREYVMSEKKPYYITTAIAYTSGKPHIGNTYEIVLTDAIARFKRNQGFDVRFQTGTDEHGQKIEEKAKAAGVTPKQFVDGVAAEIKRIWDLMNVSYDKFIRTTDEDHMAQVQKIFKKLYEQGDIYKGHYEGLYCTPCESFWTPSQLKDGKCPDCGREVKPAKEEAYFFRMNKYADRLMQYYDEHPEFITPVSRKNEMVNNFLKPGLQDLCVSRTSFKWGIPVDFDDKHVVYVWLDALSNYITGLGYDADGNSGELFRKYWPADVHVIGKDIIRFHTVYWPIFLMALGLPLPKRVFGHPWLLMDGSKMSKSRGNVIYADELASVFGVDAVRYFVLNDMPFDNDGNITWELMTDRVNADLANNLGNLVSRTAAMSAKYFGGVMRDAKAAAGPDAELREKAVSLYAKVAAKMDEFKISDALDEIFSFLRRCNKYIDETAPWLLAKDEGKKDRLATVLYNLSESIMIAASLLEPFMPETAHKIARQMNCPLRAYDSLDKFGLIADGTKVNDETEKLFARQNYKDVEAKYEQMHAETTKAEKPAPAKNTHEPEYPAEITIDDFAKVKMQIAQVIACEKVEKSDKLLKSTVKIGNETRTVVSGIAKYYSPEEMVGKKVVMITNLKPAKLRGIVSEGMILCAEDAEGNLKLIAPEADIADGSGIF